MSLRKMCDSKLDTSAPSCVFCTKFSATLVVVVVVVVAFTAGSWTSSTSPTSGSTGSSVAVRFPAVRLVKLSITPTVKPFSRSSHAFCSLTSVVGHKLCVRMMFGYMLAKSNMKCGTERYKPVKGSMTLPPVLLTARG